jgi:hypothetical protein
MEFLISRNSVVLAELAGLSAGQLEEGNQSQKQDGGPNSRWITHSIRTRQFLFGHRRTHSGQYDSYHAYLP